MISIIVPVYNVEDYLERCVKSIQSQSYGDWELLLIDDGSTDKSGEICDYYARIDSRIKSFHKKNGGQSSARNFGLDYARGSHVTFCDSDDWLANNFLETCMKELEKYNADIVTANYYAFYNEKKIIPIFASNGDVQVFNNEKALKKLLENDGTSSSVCGRIYKKEIFNHIRFQNGMLFEDAAISYKLFINSHKTVFIPRPLMFYFQREGSTMSRRDKKIRLDEIKASYLRYKDVRKLYSDEISEAAFSNYVYDMIHVVECFIRDDYNLDEIKEYDTYLRSELAKYSYKVGRLFSMRKKIEAFLWLRYPNLFKNVVMFVIRFDAVIPNINFR